MADDVTMEKVYFDTLLRRAESNDPSDSHSSAAFVTLPRHEHDQLLRMAREYNLLRDALYRGGIAADTLEILIAGNDHYGEGTKKTVPQGPEANTSNPDVAAPFAFGGQGSDLTAFSPNAQHSSYGHEWKPSSEKSSNPYRLRYSHDDGFGQPDSSYSSDEKDDDALPFMTASKASKQNQERRTVSLKKLPDGITHREVVDVVRGGAILDIFIRARERTANVSFVESTAAQSFLAYAKRNDIYIRGKRIDVGWSERQFGLSHHIATKIGMGATRNILVNNIDPNITAEEIRVDLDHIHNLVVVNIQLRNGNAYISLNSVHNSLYARTCMRSRKKYKGILIEHYLDECNQPLPVITRVSKKEYVTPVKKLNPLANRFQLLNIDGTEDGSEHGADDSASLSFMEFTKSSWDETSVAA